MNARDWMYGSTAEARRLNAEIATLDRLIVESQALTVRADALRAQAVEALQDAGQWCGACKGLCSCGGDEVGASCGHCERVGVLQ